MNVFINNETTLFLWPLVLNIVLSKFNINIIHFNSTKSQLYYFILLVYMSSKNYCKITMTVKIWNTYNTHYKNTYKNKLIRFLTWNASNVYTLFKQKIALAKRLANSFCSINLINYFVTKYRGNLVLYTF